MLLMAVHDSEDSAFRWMSALVAKDIRWIISRDRQSTSRDGKPAGTFQPQPQLAGSIGLGSRHQMSLHHAEQAYGAATSLDE